ncbi:MAG: hypothetical protein QOC83_7104, partial [Pseudonocardiales bacterium]|nr:hypothetical protein [Pseudonocardiales bacterium]
MTDSLQTDTGPSEVVRLGTFDAESWWRPADLAALPALGGGSDPAVDAMDELLAGFCDP